MELMERRDWEGRVISALASWLADEFDFPESNAIKLARTFVDQSYPEFGEEF